MSKRTQTKRTRAQKEFLGVGQLTKDGEVQNQYPLLGKKTVSYLPPVQPEIQHVMFRGISMEVKVLPGQRISMRREYERQKKAGII